MSEYISEAEESIVTKVEPVEEPAASETVEEEPAASETVELVVEEAPVEEEPVEEAEEEEAVEPASANEIETEEAVEEVPVEQVASDIREILAPVESEVSSVPTSNDNLCSLKKLVDVLGKWSGNEIKRIDVETLLKEGVEVDENLDDLEKVVEIIQLWLKKGSEFKKDNHFLHLDDYTLVEGSRHLDSEKKNKLLGKLIQFLIDCSQGKYTNVKITEFFTNFY